MRDEDLEEQGENVIQAGTTPWTKTEGQEEHQLCLVPQRTQQLLLFGEDTEHLQGIKEK